MTSKNIYICLICQKIIQPQYVGLMKGLDMMNQLVSSNTLNIITIKTIFRQKVFFPVRSNYQKPIQQRSSVCCMDDVGYKQYWLQVWWQGIFLAWGPPNARKIVIFTFSIEHPFFWPNSKANKTIYITYIQYINTYTHVYSIYYTQGNNYEQKSPKPHGVRATR